VPRPSIELERQTDLRSRAVSRLTGRAEGARVSAVAALKVLHELASSQATVADAIALLHELQVHQVEMELQDEELRSSRAELEAALHRQTQVYDCAPVGLFTVDRGTVVSELNLTGARLLGFERDALLGRTLDSFLAPHSGRVLDAMLARVIEGSAAQACALELIAGGGAPHTVNASASADPAGERFLVAFIDLGGHKGGPTSRATSP